MTGPVPFSYSAEAFPLYLRDLGMSFATAVLWGFNFIVAFTFPRLLVALFVFALSASAFFAVIYNHGTKGMRSMTAHHQERLDSMQHGTPLDSSSFCSFYPRFVSFSLCLSPPLFQHQLTTPTIDESSHPWRTRPSLLRADLEACGVSIPPDCSLHSTKHFTPRGGPKDDWNFVPLGEEERGSQKGVHREDQRCSIISCGWNVVIMKCQVCAVGPDAIVASES